MTLPTITEFAKWLETATNPRNDATARELAMTHIMAAYAKAELRYYQTSWIEPRGERAAMEDAFAIFRDIRAEAASDANLDRLADAQREENEQRQREVELERDVPWGTP